MNAVGKETLVAVSVCRDGDEVVYSVDCSSELSGDELEHYLREIIKGICTWKPGVCEEKTHSFRGTIKRQKRS